MLKRDLSNDLGERGEIRRIRDGFGYKKGRSLKTPAFFLVRRVVLLVMLFHVVVLLVVRVAAVMPLVVSGVVVTAVVSPVPLVVHLLVGLVLFRSGWGRGRSSSGGRS